MFDHVKFHGFKTQLKFENDKFKTKMLDSQKTTCLSKPKLAESLFNLCTVFVIIKLATQANKKKKCSTLGKKVFELAIG